jgi:hypothetical protein
MPFISLMPNFSRCPHLHSSPPLIIKRRYFQKRVYSKPVFFSLPSDEICSQLYHGTAHLPVIVQQNYFSVANHNSVFLPYSKRKFIFQIFIISTFFLSFLLNIELSNLVLPIQPPFKLQKIIRA